MKDLTQNQVIDDIKKQAIKFANDNGITDPLTVVYIMEAINIGMRRGLEIAITLTKTKEEKF